MINASCCSLNTSWQVDVYFIRRVQATETYELRVSYPATVSRSHYARRRFWLKGLTFAQFPADFYLDVFPFDAVRTFIAADDRSQLPSHVLLVTAHPTGVTPQGPKIFDLVPYDTGE